MNRFVWSPHVYSEEVTENVGYSEPGWQSHWGLFYIMKGTRRSEKQSYNNK